MPIAKEKHFAPPSMMKNNLAKCFLRQMSEKKTKSYTAEFKESAVKLAVESDKPVIETARELWDEC